MNKIDRVFYAMFGSLVTLLLTYMVVKSYCGSYCSVREEDMAIAIWVMGIMLLLPIWRWAVRGRV